MKTLGICIPTYRRPEFLARCIRSIIEQAESLPLKILIADDSCSDINSDVVTAAKERFAGIVYERNSSNLGINENICRVVELADTNYVWLVGEDDYFLRGSIAAVCAEIQQGNYPFIFCNYAFISDEDTETRRSALALAADVTLTTKDFISSHLWAIGFMGACLIEVTAWRRVVSDRYRGTYYAHVGFIVEMLADSAQGVRVIVRPSVANRAGDPSFITWRSDALGVYFGFERMCCIAAATVPPLAPQLSEAAAVYRKKQGYLSLRVIARMRADGIMDFLTYQNHLRNADLSILTRVVVLSMLLVPRVVFKKLLYVKRGLQGNSDS